MPDEQSPTPRPRFAVPILQPHAGSDEIGQRTLAEVAAALDGLPAGPVDLDVWLESPGGREDAAYRIALLLCHRAETLRFVVLNSARSAATLLTLCADELYMADAAELGPLDAQLSIPRGVTSARDAAKDVDFIQEQAIRLASSAGQQYRRDLQVHASDALEAGTRLAAALIEGLVKAVEPATILDAKNRLRATKRYARRLLRSRYLRRGEPVPAARRQDFLETAERLVYAYPTHDFVIDRVEALQLKLPVRRVDDYPDVVRARTALAEALLSGRRPVELIPLAPLERALVPVQVDSVDVMSGSTQLPRQYESRDPGTPSHGHSLLARTQHGSHAPGSRRPRRRLPAAASHSVTDDDLPVTGAIDLDDSWIWSLEPHLRDSRRGRHAHVDRPLTVSLPDAPPLSASTPLADARSVTSTVPATASLPLIGPLQVAVPAQSRASRRRWSEGQQQRDHAGHLEGLGTRQDERRAVISLPE